MTVDDSDWPALLADYKRRSPRSSASRALMAALTRRNATMTTFSALVVEEEAREAVILVRMRLINLWRVSGAELEALEPPFTATPTQP
jgi:hypothetical protein